MIVLSVSLLGCGDDAAPIDTGPTDTSFADASDVGADGGVDAGPAFEVQIDWEECGWMGRVAECADVEVPVDWDELEGATITVFVKHLPREASTGQLWFVTGGPGLSGIGFERRVELWDEIAPDMELFFVHHRGAGSSARLDCPELDGPATRLEADALTTCIAKLDIDGADALRAATPTSAARDVGALIEATLAPDLPVFVHGFSYGTYLVHRYLEFFPSQPDGVILDGLLDSNDEEVFLSSDQTRDRLGRELLATCSDDSECATRIPDAVAFMTDLRDSGATCLPEATYGPLPSLAGSLLGTPVGQTYMLPFLYRFARCDADDRAALTQLVASAFSLGSDPGRSGAAFVHLGFAARSAQ